MENTINLDLTNKIENNIEKEQKNFFDTMIGKAINTGIDIAIRAVLPDFLEEQVINIKDNLIENGLKDGIQKTINDAIDLGKSAVGLATGKIENIEQMQNIVKSGGILDGVSEIWDLAVNKAKKSGKISSEIASKLKTGKNAVLNNVEKNIENSFKNQKIYESKLNNYIETWKQAYQDQNFDNMEKSIKNVKKELEKLAPIEKNINEARKIENLHTLIKNNGKDFNLTKEQIELSQNI